MRARAPVGRKSGSEMFELIFDGWLFKSLCALADTPLIYGVVHMFRRFGGEPAPDRGLPR